MSFRSLGTSMLMLGLVVTTVVALRAADDKTKVKDSDVPAPGTIKFSAAPAAVQKAFNTETKNAKIELLGKGKTENNMALYRATVPVGGHDYIVGFSETGLMLEKFLAPIIAEVKLEECPPAVQKALQDDSKGAKVEAIERTTAGKRSDFMMDIVVPQGGKELRYQVVFTEDGTLVSKVFDDGSDPQDPGAAAPKETEKKAPKKGK